MRVAFLTVGDTGRRTGGYLYNARVVEGLRDAGVRVEEIVPCGASPEQQRAAAPRLDFDPNGYDVLVVDALARIVVAPHLDSWRRSVPVVAMVHELPSVAGGAGPEPEEPLLRADRVVTVSHNGRAILENKGVPAGRIHVSSPGFDRLSSAKVRASRPGAGGVRVLCVAQWIERKGILDLVRAWRLRERRGAVLEMIGETDADPDYARRVWEEIRVSAGDPVAVRGAVDEAELAGAYVAADVFALPSRYEGYGMVYAEALAYGLPVVACDIGPVPELVGRKAALLVPPDDVGPLAAALDALISDSELRRRMSVAARRRAKDLPRWQDTIDGFHGVLSAATGGRGRVA